MPSFTFWSWLGCWGSGLGVVTSLTEEPKKTFRNKDGAGDQSHAGRQKGNLVNVPDGSFLVLLGSDDCYLLNSSFGSHDETLHTRIEHSKWQVSLYEQPDVDGPFSDAIKHWTGGSENTVFCFSRSRVPGPAIYRWSTTIGEGALLAIPVWFCRVSAHHYRHLPSCHCQTKWKIDRSVTERLREPRVLHLGFQKEAEIWFRNLHCYQNLLLPWLSVLGENGNHLAQGWGRVRKVLSLFLRRKVLRF